MTITFSKVKQHLKEKHGLNTSYAVLNKLHEHILVILQDASDSAINEGRKTVMDRDIDFAISTFNKNETQAPL